MSVSICMAICSLLIIIIIKKCIRKILIFVYYFTIVTHNYEVLKNFNIQKTHLWYYCNYIHSNSTKNYIILFKCYIY